MKLTAVEHMQAYGHSETLRSIVSQGGLHHINGCEVDPRREFTF